MSKLQYSVLAGLFEHSSGSVFPVGESRWWEWLESDDAKSFRFECDRGVKSYTARKESVGNAFFWYAYKKVDGRLHKSYIGKSDELVLSRLEEVAVALGQPKPPRLPKPIGNSSKDDKSDRTAELEAEVVSLQNHIQMLQKKLAAQSDVATFYKDEVKEKKRKYKSVIALEAEKVKNNSDITRRGKDRGAVVRAVDELVKQFTIVCDASL